MNFAMIQKLTLIVLLLALKLACTAQHIPLNEQEKNEILFQLKNNPPDTDRINLIWQLGRYQLMQINYSRKSIDSALTYFNYSLKLCNELKVRKNFKYEALCRIGECYFLLNKFQLGEDFFMQVVRAYQLAADTPREARTWLRMAKKLRLGNLKHPDVAVYQARSLYLYHKSHNLEKEADVLVETGLYLQDNIKLDSAENDLLKALNLYKLAGTKDLQTPYFGLSQIYRNMGNLNKSLFYMLACLHNVNARGDTANILNMNRYYGQLGYLYADLNRPVQAMENFSKAIQIPMTRMTGAITFDETYSYLLELVRQLIITRKSWLAIQIAGKIFSRYPPADSLQQGRQAEILGLYYAAMNQHLIAEKYYLRMVKFYRVSAVDEAWGCKVLARFYIGTRQYAKAGTSMKKEFLRVPPLSQAFLNSVEDELFYYKIDSANGQLISALDHFRKYKSLSDSAFNATKSRQLTELQIQYETDKQNKDIDLLKRDGKLQHAEVIKAYNTNNVILGSIAILFIFTGLLYHNYRIKRRSNVILNSLVREKDSLLSEKEWLLKEIHHRVKNNLQIVMGLLQRQSAFIDNDEALAAIENSKNRMNSIALIHQKLYQSQNFDKISMPEYIDELIANLKDSFDLDSRIHFERQVDPIQLDVSQAVPLGLILNEAITNAIKYAYPDNQNGTISITLLRTGANLITLTIQDLGKGLPAGFNIEKISTLGLSLMKGLSKQLGGSLSLTSDQGVTARVSFKTETSVRLGG